MKTNTIRVRIILSGIVTMLLVGCGQKGPLYLPDPSEQQKEQYEAQKEKQEKNKDKQGIAD